MKCCICLKSLTPTVFCGRANAASCKSAPLICSACRAHPEALEISRLLLAEHLKDHRLRGDFKAIYSPQWKDPCGASGAREAA